MLLAHWPGNVGPVVVFLHQLGWLDTTTRYVFLTLHFASEHIVRHV